MGHTPVPRNEAERLARLRAYDVLDTAAEASFDRITRLAADLLQMPIALVSLIDTDRQWFKSRVGLDATQTPRDMAFCAHTICGTDVMIVEDATSDKRFSDNPLVTGEPAIRFYAGAPLRTSDGLNLGTLCTIDRMPRKLSNKQIGQLQDLAAIVLDELELRVQAARALQAETRFIDAVEALPNGFVLYDSEDRLVLCNGKYKQIYGLTTDLVEPGVKFEDLLRVGLAQGQFPEAQGREEEWLATRLEHHRNPKHPIEQQLPDDRWLRIEERRMRDGGLVGFRVDITELKRQQRELAELAWFDSLTGALNRRRFFELGNIETRRAQRTGRCVAVLLMDIDHFKKINDKSGHAVGDAVLKGLVERWNQMLRSHDNLCRMGGEEFAVLLAECDPDTLGIIADRIRAATELTPITVDDVVVQATVSIGYTVCKVGRESLEDALSRADAALYTAKNSGRNCSIAAAA